MSAPERLTAALADRYTVERELGAGGMATVYLAEDIKHDRKVAIKVLRPELAAVIGAERFLSEIKTTANLQHPHILPLFDSGQVNGTVFYVMPFVEGESLRDRLDREKQLSIADAVRITTEVASALDYAHRHGVIHRDIKPDNILLHDGRALVADFGIALAATRSEGGSRMTETGMSLGTPHYMSPEQAMGERDLDARTDVYALGCVCYEMLTGETPFTGPSAQSIIAKVMTERPTAPSATRDTVPAHVEDAVMQALAKLPVDRFGTAAEFAQALANPGFTTSATGRGLTGPHRAPTLRTQLRSPLVLALAATAVIAMGLALAAWRTSQRAVALPVVRFQVTMPSMMLTANAAPGKNVAVSPDGHTIAFALADSAAAVRLTVRRLEDAAARTIAGTDGAQQPTFSPDGQWIAYMVGTNVWKIPTEGGSPVLVGDAGQSPIGLTWTRGGAILVGATGGLLSLPVAGGPPRFLVVPDSANGELYFNGPLALADGETVLITIQTIKGVLDTRLGAVSLKTGTVRRFDLNVLDVIGYLDGTLVYVLPTGALMAIDLDLNTGNTSGAAVALGPTVVTTLSSIGQVAMSGTGTLIYQPGNDDAALGWVGLDGRFTTILSEPQNYGYPRLSPDGKRIAVSFGANGRADVWLYDIASATPTRLTNAGGANDRPEWTPDGQRIVYRTDRAGQSAIWWQRADLGAPPEPLLFGATKSFFEGVIAPDDRTLIYQVDNSDKQQADILYRSLDGDTTSQPVAATRFVEAQARLSPDGQWVAYVTDASGTVQVVAQSFPVAGARVQVSVSGGSEPVWARDGKTIFYRDGRHLVAASVSTSDGLAVTKRTDLFPDTFQFAQAPHANYDVAPDGRRFLMIRNSRTPEYQVVVGWRTELQTRMQAERKP